MRITKECFTRVTGVAPKPESVWERQFDYNDEDLVRLARTDWDKIADEDLWYYFHDLAYVELQPELFRHMFPACLKYWYETLMRGEDATRGDADFHYGLLQGRILERMLSPAQNQALLEFFRHGFLDRIESQGNFAGEGDMAHHWIYRFNSLGVVAPVVQAIWEPWWSLDHSCKAICALMYASGLIYLRGENPIYPDHDGGGPYLTEQEGYLYDWAWRLDNLGFLRKTLSVDYVCAKVEQAAAALADHSAAAVAQRIAGDARSRTDVIAIRIEDLVESLGKIASERMAWE
ncbi:MAG: hypothetical protein U0Q16_05820 [Bryobacteraceae bacterium]